MNGGRLDGPAPAIGQVAGAVAGRVVGRGDAPGSSWATPMAWLAPAIALQAIAGLIEQPSWQVAGWQVVLAGALLGCGAWLVRAAEQELRWHATPVCVDESARALVATGPYRLSRHPMYAGMALLLASTAVVLGSWLAGAVAAGFALWLDLRHARPEDARLRATFGPAWWRYQAQVRRWF